MSSGRFPEKLKSRKFWVLCSSVILFLANDIMGLGLDAEAVQHIVLVVGAYLVGQGLADWGKDS